MKLLELCRTVLAADSVREPLTPQQIWERAQAMGLDNQVSLPGGKPAQSIMKQIVHDVHFNPKSVFYEVDRRKLRYYLKEKENAGAFPPLASPHQEKDLHPLLVRFIHDHEHFQAYAKTIDQSARRSWVQEKKGTNRWLHPDIVGVRFTPGSVLNSEPSRPADLPVKFFAFELKLALHAYDLTPYDQACNDSSWAHEGYLVVGTMDDDPELLTNLLRLQEEKGIGVICLDLKKPEKSRIVMPAREKPLDEKQFNRLVEENADFFTLVEGITGCYRAGTINGTVFDPVLTDEQVAGHIEKQNIQG
ncbi:MAG: hypothetical protein GYA23_10875 [Methanomicrobiales archaeon]|nr:hypothetical protein [Methanomicrobiales archaeon]